MEVKRLLKFWWRGKSLLAPRSAVLGLASLLVVLSVLWLGGCATGQFTSASSLKVKKPAALRPGDTIGFISPSSSIDGVKMERAIRILKERGYRVKVPAGLYDRDGYLAGDDWARARQFEAVLNDPEVDAVFAAAGGYGAMRMLDFVNFDRLQHPKIVTGFSDITAVHMALWSQCGWSSFHSPNMIDGFGQGEGFKATTRSWFWRLLESDGEGFVLGTEPLASDSEHCPVPIALTPGVARGRLVGGNLSLVSALVGTPYELKTKGCLLFLEDVGERPYRIDRMLSQMKLAGQFDSLAGVVLGQFTDCEPTRENPTWFVDRVLKDYFAGLGVPVLMNFPAGHDHFNSVVPLGYEAELDADRGRIRILESLWR